MGLEPIFKHRHRLLALDDADTDTDARYGYTFKSSIGRHNFPHLQIYEKGKEKATIIRSI